MNRQGKDRKTAGQKKAEIKVGIAYDGWKKTGKDRYELPDKVIVAGFAGAKEFQEYWEAAIAEVFDLEEVSQRILNADGAYSGTENAQLAADKNVELITTSLTGKPAPDILADFVFNEEGTRVLGCPAGHAPKSCSYMKQSNRCSVSFLSDQCANCPYQKQCKLKIFKRVAKIVTSKTAHERAKIQRNMTCEEFKNYAKLRNGVETIPANIRRNYHLEKMPRGKQRGKFFFGSKIAALNFRKLFNYVKGLGNYTQNPIFA